MKPAQACTLLVLSHLTSAIPHAQFTPLQITWSSSCTAGQVPGLAGLLPADTSLPGLECGSLLVPLDYAGKDSGNINLGFTRLRTNSTKRLGTLIYNPGGPGGSGSLQIAGLALGVFTPVSAIAQEHYDLVGYDSRGVGMSTPIQCDPTIWNQHVSTAGTDQKSFDALVAKNKALGASCEKLTGPLLNHLDTTSVAKDLEELRVALDDGKLNLVGISYGTQIGSQYVELFPENMGRFVLDGNVDHSQSETSSLMAESTTYEATLNQWFSWCNTTDDCALRGQDVVGIFDKVVAALPDSAIPAPGCVDSGACQPTVWGEDIIYSVQGFLGVTGVVPSISTNWALLSEALLEASQGNATLLSPDLAQSQTDVAFPGLAVLCQDWRHTASTPEDIKLRLETASIFAPHTKGICQTFSLQTECIGWPAPVSNPQHWLDQAKTAKAPPLLLVNALYDPETSFLWARGLKEQLPSARLLIRDGAGHSSYFLGGQTTDVIDAFLINGTLPADGFVTTS